MSASAPETRALLTAPSVVRSPAEFVRTHQQRQAAGDVVATIETIWWPVTARTPTAASQIAEQEPQEFRATYRIIATMWMSALVWGGVLVWMLSSPDRGGGGAACGAMSNLIMALIATTIARPLLLVVTRCAWPRNVDGEPLPVDAVPLAIGCLRTLATLRSLASFICFWWLVALTVQSDNTAGCSGSPVRTLSICIIVVYGLPGAISVALIVLVCCCTPCIFLMAIPVLRALRALGVVTAAVSPANEAQIAALPTVTYTASPSNVAPDNVTCGICLVDYAVNDELTQLPCTAKHVFHRACIKEWLQVNGTCPMDRMPMANGVRPGAMAPHAAAPSSV